MKNTNQWSWQDWKLQANQQSWSLAASDGEQLLSWSVGLPLLPGTGNGLPTLQKRLSGIPLPTDFNEATQAYIALELTMLGLDQALLALYRETQDQRYLDFCLEKLNLAAWDLPIVEGRHTKIEGHAYAYFTRCLVQLDLREITVDVVQQTGYPSSGDIRLSVSPSRPERFEVRLRIPSWCQQFSLKVNGRTIQAPVDNGLLGIAREWSSGDVVELAMEMPWRLVRGVAKQDGRAAVMRGPLVFCLNPMRNAEAGETSLIVDSTSFEPPVPDETLRPHGIACRQTHEPALFTGFPDPDGEATYFTPASNDLLTADELLKS